MPRDLVLHLREMFKDSWKEIITEESRAKAKKRKPWSEKRFLKMQSETGVREAKKQEKVDKLLNFARGKIE